MQSRRLQVEHGICRSQRSFDRRHGWQLTGFRTRRSFAVVSPALDESGLCSFPRDLDGNADISMGQVKETLRERNKSKTKDSCAMDMQRSETTGGETGGVGDN